jgi:hypothetical protein
MYVSAKIAAETQMPPDCLLSLPAFFEWLCRSLIVFSITYGSLPRRSFLTSVIPPSINVSWDSIYNFTVTDLRNVDSEINVTQSWGIALIRCRVDELTPHEGIAPALRHKEAFTTSSRKSWSKVVEERIIINQWIFMGKKEWSFVKAIYRYSIFRATRPSPRVSPPP